MQKVAKHLKREQKKNVQVEICFEIANANAYTIVHMNNLFVVTMNWLENDITFYPTDHLAWCYNKRYAIYDAHK